MTSKPLPKLGASLERAYGRFLVRTSIIQSVSFDIAHSNTLHAHERYYEICFVTKGQGNYIHGNEHFTLRAHDIFIANPSVIHEIRSYETKDLTLFFLSFLVQKTSAQPGGGYEERLLDAFLHDHAIHAAKRAYLAHYVSLLDTFTEGEKSRAPFMEATHMTFLFEMIAALTASFTPAEDTYDTRTYVNRACAYIGDRLAQKLTVEEIALHAGTSERNLRRLFQRELGRTVTEEIHARKMNYAIYLLSMRIKVKDVGMYIGIEDAAQFSRLFKKHFGVAPKAFQQHMTDSVIPGKTTYPRAEDGRI